MRIHDIRADDLLCKAREPTFISRTKGLPGAFWYSSLRLDSNFEVCNGSAETYSLFKLLDFTRPICQNASSFQTAERPNVDESSETKTGAVANRLERTDIPNKESPHTFTGPKRSQRKSPHRKIVSKIQAL